jgi:hypothetical protein
MNRPEEFDKTMTIALGGEAANARSATGTLECNIILSSEGASTHLAYDRQQWERLDSIPIPNPSRHWWCFWRPRWIFIRWFEHQ